MKAATDRGFLLRASSAVVALVAGCILSPLQVIAQTSTPISKMIAAARAEGQVTWYSALVVEVNQGIVDAFKKKYGIDVQVLRLSSGPLTQRFSAEAEANKVAADVIMPTSSGPFLASALAKGWTTAVDKADLPSIQSGEYPSRWLRPEQGAAIVQIAPWIWGYNEKVLSGLNVAPPKDWLDLLDPKLKGQIIMTTVTGSDSYVQLWDFILRAYGVEYLQRFKAQNIRIASNSVMTTQSLAAGEGAIALPMIGSLIVGVASKGAPVKAVVPAKTTGNEIAITLSKAAPHPNGARLLVDFILSREGNTVLGSMPNEFSVYASGLPGGYQSPRESAVAENKSRVLQLLEGR